jgi:hypothetical protein
VTLLDLDTENKTRGSLAHFFGGQVPKINIHTPEGLDAFLDYLDTGPPIVLADMGGGAGRVTHTWFDQMYAHVAQCGIAFTAVGVVTCCSRRVKAASRRPSEIARSRRVTKKTERSPLASGSIRSVWYWRERLAQLCPDGDPSRFEEFGIPDGEEMLAEVDVPAAQAKGLARPESRPVREPRSTSFLSWARSSAWECRVERHPDARPRRSLRRGRARPSRSADSFVTRRLPPVLMTAMAVALELPLAYGIGSDADMVPPW